MARLRLDNISSFGTTNPITLADDSTTLAEWLTSPPFPTINEGDIAVVVAQPDTELEEIMHLLPGFTAGDTSGQVLRAAEPTAQGQDAFAHNGVPWQHGPTALDFAYQGVYTNPDGHPSGTYVDGAVFAWVINGDVKGFLLYGSDSGWESVLHIAQTNIGNTTAFVMDGVLVPGVLDAEAGSYIVLQGFIPNLEQYATDTVIEQTSSVVIEAVVDDITITLPTVTSGFQGLNFWVKNKSTGRVTLSSLASASMLASTQPTDPLTVVTSVNDSFIYTPSGGPPETFTIAPGTYLGASIPAAMASATGSLSGEPFSTYANVGTDGPLNSTLACIGVTLGTGQNGDALNVGVNDVLVDLGFTDGQTFAGGGNTNIDGQSSITLLPHQGVMVQWDDATWFVNAAVGISTSPSTVTGQLSAVTDTHAKAVLTSMLAAMVAAGIATDSTT